MLGVGIIGAGRIAAAHARAVQELDDATLVAVADISGEAIKRFTQMFPCAGYTDYRELLARDDVNIAVICLPHHLHKKVTVDAANAGKHVFVEKPLALDVRECDEIIEAAQRNNVKLHVGHHHHFVPANCKAKEILSSGEIGGIVIAVDTWYKPFFIKGAERPPWFLDRACGGGMWYMNGPHMIDRLMFLISSRVTAVKASIGNKFYDYSAHDIAVAHLEFENGVHAQMVHCGYRNGVERFELDLTCSEAQLKLRGNEVLIGRDNEWTIVDFPKWNTHVRQHEGFVRSILDDTETPVTGEWGREVVRVMGACEESSGTGYEARVGL